MPASRRGASENPAHILDWHTDRTKLNTPLHCIGRNYGPDQNATLRPTKLHVTVIVTFGIYTQTRKKILVKVIMKR